MSAVSTQPYQSIKANAIACAQNMLIKHGTPGAFPVQPDWIAQNAGYQCKPSRNDYPYNSDGYVAYDKGEYIIGWQLKYHQVVSPFFVAKLLGDQLVRASQIAGLIIPPMKDGDVYQYQGDTSPLPEIASKAVTAFAEELVVPQEELNLLLTYSYPEETIATHFGITMDELNMVRRHRNL